MFCSRSPLRTGRGTAAEPQRAAQPRRRDMVRLNPISLVAGGARSSGAAHSAAGGSRTDRARTSARAGTCELAYPSAARACVSSCSGIVRGSCASLRLRVRRSSGASLAGARLRVRAWRELPRPSAQRALSARGERARLVALSPPRAERSRSLDLLTAACDAIFPCAPLLNGDFVAGSRLSLAAPSRRQVLVLWCFSGPRFVSAIRRGAQLTARDRPQGATLRFAACATHFRRIGAGERS